MKKFLILTAFVGVLIFVPQTAVKAQTTANADVTLDEIVTATDLGVPEPSSGLIGWLRNLAYNLQYGLTFNPVKKAEMKLDHASQNLLEAEKYLAENPEDTQFQQKYEKALAKYEKNMKKVETLTENFHDKANTSSTVSHFLDKYVDAISKHQTVIDKMKGNLEPEKLQLLEKINEETIKSFGEILTNSELPERIPERIANAVENRDGSDFRYMKGLELLSLIDENSRGDFKSIVQQAEELTTHRFYAAWENLDPEARTERFKEYLYGSSGDPLIQLEVLGQLEEAGNLPSGLNSLIQAAKTDKVQKIDDAINAFKNDEHRVKYLERVRQIEDPLTKPLLQNIENRYNNPETPGEPTRLDRAVDNVKDDIQQQGTTDSSVNPVQEDKDLRDAIRNRQGNNSNENS